MNDTERRVRVQCRDRRPPVHWAPYAEQQRTWRTVLAPPVGKHPVERLGRSNRTMSQRFELEHGPERSGRRECCANACDGTSASIGI